MSLVQPGQGGMQTLASVKTDAKGNFQFDRESQGPILVQAFYRGVLYNKMVCLVRRRAACKWTCTIPPANPASPK